MRPVQIEDAVITYENGDDLAYLKFRCLRSGKADYRTLCLKSADSKKTAEGNEEMTQILISSGVGQINDIDQLVGSKVVMCRRGDGTVSYGRYIHDDMARRFFEDREKADAA